MFARSKSFEDILFKNGLNAVIVLATGLAISKSLSVDSSFGPDRSSSRTPVNICIQAADFVEN